MFDILQRDRQKGYMTATSHRLLLSSYRRRSNATLQSKAEQHCRRDKLHQSINVTLSL